MRNIYRFLFRLLGWRRKAPYKYGNTAGSFLWGTRSIMVECSHCLLPPLIFIGFKPKACVLQAHLKYKRCLPDADNVITPMLTLFDLTLQ